MQAISGALQMSGGIILLLVRQPVLFSAPVLLVRTSAFALLSFGARWVGETLVCRRCCCCCWTVETVLCERANEASASHYCKLLHFRCSDARHVQFSLT